MCVYVHICLDIQTHTNMYTVTYVCVHVCLFYRGNHVNSYSELSSQLIIVLPLYQHGIYLIL